MNTTLCPFCQKNPLTSADIDGKCYFCRNPESAYNRRKKLTEEFEQQTKNTKQEGMNLGYASSYIRWLENKLICDNANFSWLTLFTNNTGMTLRCGDCSYLVNNDCSEEDFECKMRVLYVEWLEKEANKMREFLISLHGNYSDVYDYEVMGVDEIILKAKWTVNKLKENQKEISDGR